MTGGFWWMEPKVYLHDRPQALWTNFTRCVARQPDWFLTRLGQEEFSGEDRRFDLCERPAFDLSEREKRPLALRSVRGTNDKLKPLSCHLASAEFVALVEEVDPALLKTADIDFSVHGRPVSSEYVLADAAHGFDAWTALDRSKSCMKLEISVGASGARWRRATVERIVVREHVVGDHALFRLMMGSANSRLVASDALAECIMAQGLPGIAFEDATGFRKPPPEFAKDSKAGWRKVHPA